MESKEGNTFLIQYGKSCYLYYVGLVKEIPINVLIFNFQFIIYFLAPTREFIVGRYSVKDNSQKVLNYSHLQQNKRNKSKF